MNIIEEAQKALALVREGEDALKAIADAVKGGTAAVDASTQQQLNTLLEQARASAKEAHDNLQNAINTSRL